MAYTVFESVNMASTKYAERIFDAVATTDIENGTFGYLDGLATGEDVTYNFKVGTKAGAQVVVVDQPAWDADTTKITNQSKDKFIIKAGTRFRVRVVKVNDEFGISIEGVTSASKDKMDVNAFVTIDSTGKLVASTSTTSSAVFEGVVMRKRTSGNTLTTAGGVTYGASKVIYEVKVKTLA